MADHFLVNQVEGSFADVFRKLVDLLITHGWVCIRSSTGTVLSNPGENLWVDLAAVANPLAWICIQSPIDNRGFSIQRSATTSNNGRVGYAPPGSGDYSGGGESATRIPDLAAAVVEVAVFGGGTPAAPTHTVLFDSTPATHVWHAMVRDVNKGEFWMMNYKNGLQPSLIFALDPVSPPADTGDTDPVMIWARYRSSDDVLDKAQLDPISIITVVLPAPFALVPVAPLDTELGYQRMRAEGFQQWGGDRPANRVDGETLFRVLEWGRKSNEAPAAFKGASTLIAGTQVGHSRGSTHTVDGVVRSHVVYGHCAFPWGGNVPPLV